MEATGTGNRFLMKTAILIGTIFLELPVWRPQGEREQVPDSPGLRVFLLQGPGLLWTSKGYFLFCSLSYLSLYLPYHLYRYTYVCMYIVYIISAHKKHTKSPFYGGFMVLYTLLFLSKVHCTVNVQVIGPCNGNQEQYWYGSLYSSMFEYSSLYR